MQGRRRQRGHEPDGAGHEGQGAFATSVKHSLGLQLGLETQKLLKQGPPPDPCHGFDDELEVAPRFVNAQASTHLNLLTVAG